MEVEAWRNKHLSDEEIAEVRTLLYSLPKTSWPIARQLPPLSLVKISVPTGSPMLTKLMGKELFGMVLDYGISHNQPFVISAVLDDDGNPLLDHEGRLQVGITVPSSLSMVASCGPITSQWMTRNFSDS